MEQTCRAARFCLPAAESLSLAAAEPWTRSAHYSCASHLRVQSGGAGVGHGEQAHTSTAMPTPTRNPSEVRVEVAPSTSEDAAEDVSESCTICMSRPRAVRFLPCQHAVMCEGCAMAEMKRTGMCSHCRQPVEGLVFVPVTPLRPKRLKTHQDEPEPEGLYQSKEEFLQQAEAAQAARDGAARYGTTR